VVDPVNRVRGAFKGRDLEKAGTKPPLGSERTTRKSRRRWPARQADWLTVKAESFLKNEATDLLENKGPRLGEVRNEATVRNRILTGEYQLSALGYQRSA